MHGAARLFGAGSLLQFRRALEQKKREARNQDDGGRLRRDLDAERNEEPLEQPMIRGCRAGRLKHAVDEACGRSGSAERVQEPDRAGETIKFARALGALGEMRGERGVIIEWQRFVHPLAEPFTGLIARHVKKRSSLSLRSIRARCSRERTVPSSRSSAPAISSYDNPSRSRSTTTMRRSSGNSAMARRSAA